MNRYRRRDTDSFATLPENDPVRTAGRRATQLVGMFFGLSVSFMVLTAMADTEYPGTITVFVWGRVVTELILAAAFFLFVFLMQRGKFWGYLRMLMTSALSLLSTLSIVLLAGDYPWWLRSEQALQALIPAALLFILARPTMRQRFAKKS